MLDECLTYVANILRRNPKSFRSDVDEAQLWKDTGKKIGTELRIAVLFISYQYVIAEKEIRTLLKSARSTLVYASLSTTQWDPALSASHNILYQLA